MRIAYVEDNATNQALVERVARMTQHVIVPYDEGEIALEALRSEPFDLIMMDIELAGKVNGLDVVRSLRSASLKTPIIAVTAYAMLGDRDRCLEAGCDDYLPKPIPIKELLDLLGKYDARLKAAVEVPVEVLVEPAPEAPAETVTAPPAATEAPSATVAGPAPVAPSVEPAPVPAASVESAVPQPAEPVLAPTQAPTPAPDVEPEVMPEVASAPALAVPATPPVVAESAPAQTEAPSEDPAASTTQEPPTPPTVAVTPIVEAPTQAEPPAPVVPPHADASPALDGARAGVADGSETAVTTA